MVQAKFHCDCVFGVMCKPYQRYIVKIPRKIAFKGRNDTILASCFYPDAAYELIAALTAKSAPPRKFELSIPQRDDKMIANVVEGAINSVEAQIGY